MAKNIVVLSGSPRKEGNTDMLVASFVEGAKSADKNVVVFRVADMKIGGCLGCRHCFKEKGVCVQKDDMEEILKAIQKADTLVFASPIYFFDMTAQLKLAIDRTYALLSVGTLIKKAAFLITCGDDSEKAAEGTVVTFKSICAYSKWEDGGVIIVPAVNRPGAIKGRAELVKAMTFGREI